MLGIELAVSFGRNHIKFHTGTFLRTFKALFEPRNHHMGAVDVLQGSTFAGCVYLFSFNCERVFNGHYLVLSNFHNILFYN